MFCFDQASSDCAGLPELAPLHFSIQLARLTPSDEVPCQLCDQAGVCGPSLCPGVPVFSAFQAVHTFDGWAGPLICPAWEPQEPGIGEVFWIVVVVQDAAGNRGAPCP